jgi:addiction module HigA family antidote|tara:strand:- start:560 stop:1312 length:753 start_codon:yes stop_codon:yes gene_type:complete
MLPILAAIDSVDNSLGVFEVEAQTVRQWLEAGEIVLVDVRETAEYEQEHISGSVLCPLSVFNPNLFPKIPDKVVVIHCAIGKRSAAAARQLINNGHLRIANLQGGIKAWKKSGGATETLTLQSEEPKKLPKLRELIPNGQEGILIALPKSEKTQKNGIHPGRILLEEFLLPLGISQVDLAEKIKAPVSRINSIIKGKSKITADTALRLSRFFCTTEEFWLHLQVTHDLKKARDAKGKVIEHDVQIHRTEK